MIPKTIHYCWFGGKEKPKKVNRCIESWRKLCPEFEIIEWNEHNYNIKTNQYTKYCYENKKWAFLSDYVRLDIIYRYGGLYFDTDVEIIKRFDFLLEYGAFYCFEDNSCINTGEGFGAKAYHPAVNAMKQIYELYDFVEEQSFSMIKCPQMNTEGLLPFGLQLNGQTQILDDVIVLSSDYMNPYDDTTGKLNKTHNTFSIHWYSKSWMRKKYVIKSKLTQPFHYLQKIFDHSKAK